MKSNANGVSAVIFDLDGLLVDSEPIQLLAWDRYLAQFGHALDSSLTEHMYGRRLADAAAAVVERLQLPVSAEVVAIERDAIFLELARDSIPPKPGARQLITDCTDAGLTVALATSGHRPYANIALESANLADLFAVEITGEMVNNGKPEPDTFLRVAQELEIEPLSCLVLEDSPNGVRAAKAAGMRCFAIPDQLLNSSAYELADSTLTSLDDVMTKIAAFGWIQEKESQG